MVAIGVNNDVRDKIPAIEGALLGSLFVTSSFQIDCGLLLSSMSQRVVVGMKR